MILECSHSNSHDCWQQNETIANVCGTFNKRQRFNTMRPRNSNCRGCRAVRCTFCVCPTLFSRRPRFAVIPTVNYMLANSSVRAIYGRVRESQTPSCIHRISCACAHARPYAFRWPPTAAVPIQRARIACASALKLRETSHGLSRSRIETSWGTQRVAPAMLMRCDAACVMYAKCVHWFVFRAHALTATVSQPASRWIDNAAL